MRGISSSISFSYSFRVPQTGERRLKSGVCSMGNLSSKLSGLCSKSSTHSGGHTLVDPTGIHESTHGANGTPIDARRAAAEAAEKRREAVSIIYLSRLESSLNLVRNNSVV